MNRLSFSLLLVLPIALVWPDARGARADPPTFERSAAQRAFAAGDVVSDFGADARGATDPAARLFVWLRDGFWRPKSGGVPFFDGPDRSAQRAEAHAKWLVRGVNESGQADPAAGEPSLLALLEALVLDRVRREREGLHSTRTEGPLAAVAADEYIGYFLDGWVPGAYGGAAAIADRRERAPERALRDDAARNVWLAVGAVLGLFVLAAVGGMVLGRAAPKPDEFA